MSCTYKVESILFDVEPRVGSITSPNMDQFHLFEKDNLSLLNWKFQNFIPISEDFIPRFKVLYVLNFQFQYLSLYSNFNWTFEDLSLVSELGSVVDML